MLEGYATNPGTKRFKDRHREIEDHFRLINDLHLTSIGMGTYLGSVSYEDDKKIIEAIKLSTSKGAINVIDTAINYRSQKSERAIGKALKEMLDNNIINSREEMFISSKNGYITDDGDLNIDLWNYVYINWIRTNIIKPEDISSSYHCMKISYLEDQLNKSRRNLNLECIDLMYLHNPAESQVHDVGRDRFFKMLKEVFEFYEAKIKEGKIRYYGLATWNSFRVMPDHIEHLNLYDLVKLAKSINESHGFRFIQLPLNPLMQEALKLKNQSINGEMLNVIEAASRLGIHVFTSVPLMQGRILDKVKLERSRLTPALICLQFARSLGVIPLVGQKDPKHVMENIEITKIKWFEKINNIKLTPS